MRKFKRSDFPANASTPAEVERACKNAGLEIIDQRGFQWCIAPTGSDSRTVAATSVIEKWLGLHRWHAQSPWLLYATRRVALAVGCFVPDWLVTTTEVWA